MWRESSLLFSCSCCPSYIPELHFLSPSLNTLKRYLKGTSLAQQACTALAQHLRSRMRKRWPIMSP